jgi:hypothetical protein
LPGFQAANAEGHGVLLVAWSMIPKSGHRFSEKIMRKR